MYITRKQQTFIAILASLCGFALLFGALPLLTHAQGGISVKLQPTTIEERVDPGAVIEGVLVVTNENGGTQTYTINTRNIDGMEDNGRPIFSEEPADDPMRAAAWIIPLQKHATMEVGASVEIPYQIHVPKDASPGSYVAAIFVTREAEGTSENGAGVGFNVGTLVNLRVNGEVRDDMVLKEFSSDRSFYTMPNVAFTIRVENTGTIYQRPRGVITITDMLGNVVEEITLNEERTSGVLPRTERVLNHSWTTEDFTFGRYTALVNVGYGDTAQRTLKEEISFWIIPWKEVGLVAAGLAVCILLVVIGLRTYVRRELAKAGHVSEKLGTSSTTFARRVSRVLVRLMILLALLAVGVLVFFA